MPVTLLLPAVKLLRLPVRLLEPRWTGWLIGVPVMCHAPQGVPSADRQQKHFPVAARRPRWASAGGGCRPWSQAPVTPDDRGCRHSRRRRGLGCGGTAAPGPLDGPDRLSHDSARPARDRAPLAGLLLAVPALEDTGLLNAARQVYGPLRDGFYGLTATLLTLVFLALAGEPRAEGAMRSVAVVMRGGMPMMCWP